MEKNPYEIIREICVHHRIEPLDIAARLLEVVIGDTTLITQTIHMGDAINGPKDEYATMLYNAALHLNSTLKGAAKAASTAAAEARSVAEKAVQSNAENAAGLASYADASERNARAATATYVAVKNARTAGEHDGTQAAIRWEEFFRNPPPDRP